MATENWDYRSYIKIIDVYENTEWRNSIKEFNSNVILTKTMFSENYCIIEYNHKAKCLALKKKLNI